MAATLYFNKLSHPSHAARLMLEHKRIEHRLVNLLPGVHNPLVRLAGFPGWTVPALRIDGRRIQGSLKISRALEEIRPDPPLFPPDPAERRAVEEAERWGEAELQPVPRRVARYALARDPALRRWLARDIIGLRLPGPLLSTALVPVTRALAWSVDVDERQARADLDGLPALLDHVDSLLEAGPIGTERRNAADFQIATSVRLLLALDDLRPSVEGRRCEPWARGILPEYPGQFPPSLPPEWLPVPRS